MGSIDPSVPSTTGSVVPPSPPSSPPSLRHGSTQFAVGVVVRDFVDGARQRNLHTVIYYPADGPPASPGATPAPGRFPLVMMAHGFLLPATGYERILERVAAAGYVVAAPAFPHTSAERGDGQRSDIVNQPGDLSFVADAIVELTRTEAGFLPVLAHPDRIGAMGHSDGGLTVSAWAYGNSFSDPRIGATVVMSGGIGMFPGGYFERSSPPLLAIHSTADETNPYSASVALIDAVPAGTPRFLLTIEGGSHLGPYMFDTALSPVGQVIVDFLDAYLEGDAGAGARLLADGHVPGALTIRGG